ncbi:FHA domain-containing protein [Thermomonas sp.]|uniref:FHA domain-containing protein n=1 Tax=Thermomonas sp. TaxID=1971895 RepID=UPI0024874A34|nr:FHA domain-containing protein [Thermomonas sp.]MDI1253470.1 FHA domain-containing protein [Thermomonas sp.]
MNELRLRFCDGEQPDLVLGAGLHALGRLPNGLGPVDAEQPWLLQLCNDRRGIWLTVADDLRGVHVNGRPVQHVAMLRAGDSIHVDGGELLLTAANDPGKVLPTANGQRDMAATSLRLVLRGIGGQHHGRSINLEQPRRIGRGSDADIRIEGQGIVERHALIEAVNGQAVLRDAQADVMVNGHRTRQAVLQAGDQIAFDVQHRFVVEGPPPHAIAGNTAMHSHSGYADDAEERPYIPRRSWLVRMPWLLLAAILLAAALSGLLLFGAR